MTPEFASAHSILGSASGGVSDRGGDGRKACSDGVPLDPVRFKRGFPFVDKRFDVMKSIRAKIIRSCYTANIDEVISDRNSWKRHPLLNRKGDREL